MEEQATVQDRDPLEPSVAFARWCAAERPGMVRLAFLLTGSLEAAEDAVQESLARIQPRYGGLDRPAAYLRTCVVNATRSWHRRERRTSSLLPEPMAAGLDTETVEVWEALTRLTPRRRRTVVLRYWVDLSTDEIAEAMGCRPGTVSSLLHRGLADLRKELDGDG